MNGKTVWKPSWALKATRTKCATNQEKMWVNVFCQVFFFQLACLELLKHSSVFICCVCVSQRLQTQKNGWSLSTRPWSCCRQLTARRCDTSWLTSRGLNAQVTLSLNHVPSVVVAKLFCFPPLLHPEWPSTRRRTSCPARTWVSSSARRWWGPPSWTPWRRSTTSDTRDLWWKRSLPMKTCCSEMRGGGKRSFRWGEEGRTGWEDASTRCPPVKRWTKKVTWLFTRKWRRNTQDTWNLCLAREDKPVFVRSGWKERWRKRLFAKKEWIKKT